MPTLTGNFDVHPRAAYNSLRYALVELGCTDETGEASAISCVDAGVPIGDMEEGQTGVRCNCSARHGLHPGDHIQLVSTGLYDGNREVEPIDDWAFYILSVPFVGTSGSGRWEPLS